MISVVPLLLWFPPWMLRGIISARPVPSDVVDLCHLEAGEITHPPSNPVSFSQNGCVFVASQPESCWLHVGKPVGQHSSCLYHSRRCRGYPPAPGAPESKMCQEGQTMSSASVFPAGHAHSPLRLAVLELCMPLVRTVFAARVRNPA